jgi:hypothetical protein
MIMKMVVFHLMAPCLLRLIVLLVIKTPFAPKKFQPDLRSRLNRDTNNWQPQPL